MGFLTNYLLNLGALARGREPRRPLLFSYYVTHRCRLNCRYCCDGGGRRFREDPCPELDTAQARALVDILSRSADTLDITGGEPLLRDDLEEILAHLSSPKLDPVEAVLVPFARDTVRYEPVLIQRRARTVSEQLSGPQFLEALGIVGLANMLCRLGLLVQEP